MKQYRILRRLGGHLGLSGALLELPWAITGPLTALGDPFQTQGRTSPNRGHRGKGKPLSERRNTGLKERPPLIHKT